MTKTTIVSDDEAVKTVECYQEVKRNIKMLEKQKEKLEQQLYNFMGEHDVMINHETGEEFVNWSYSKGYQRFDAKKFMVDKPKVYKQYLFMTDPVRTLRVVK